MTTSPPATARTRISAAPSGGAFPGWAVLQRKLLDELDRAWRLFRDRCTEADGRVRFDNPGYLSSRDAVDDFYEIFFNWPVLATISGSTDLLDAAKRHWTGTTRMLEGLGRLHDEYEIGYDWFHQGEGNLLFYGVCLASPQDPLFADRAARFARLYLGGPPGNYDPARNMMRAIHTGSGGPRYGLRDEQPARYPWTRSMDRYGLPITWLPGIDSYETLLADEARQLRLGAEMEHRMGRGDAVVSLGATTLALNAYLMTGDETFRDWMLRYTDGWVERAAANGGVVPDNVGPHGTVGELMDGRWYGGHYGWSFPHGLESVGSAALIAAINCHLVAPDRGYLEFARRQLDFCLDQAVEATPDRIHPDMRAELVRRHGLDPHAPTILAPVRYTDGGHFDYQPPHLDLLTALWNVSQDDHDRRRLRQVRQASSSDPREFRLFRNKGEDGHCEPWLAYLDGENPGYPQAALAGALSVLSRRLDLIEADTTDPRAMTEWHYQALNPVLTEVLLQLCCGGPQVIYNGGVLQTQVRYFRPDGTPGLPPDVAALVTRITADEIDLQLVNTSLAGSREVTVVGGALGEHVIAAATWSTVDSWPGRLADQFAPTSPASRHHRDVAAGTLDVVLAPGADVRLTLYLDRHAAHPTYRPLDRTAAHPRSAGTDDH
ncbi:hypothetical protein [Micromonospora cathayae]|uniref:Uncharacterized protein n=1 Tax=Micromonospora cathayae TaxID=3028804 RepID=A0ABY8A190_9ACTN|nr:hypothetical protein [Micromonospora sp. HUAS 3]WDZ87759.1 hypothetical protein PVK37_15805 [Micromonospora sp. HUAS 3]